MESFATDDEIVYAHDLLLPGRPAFSQEQIDIIKANDSRDVQACPGSGKTTTLLAKLIILANRMPFEDGKGICVLTHTNVAIDEIRARIGQKADVLSNYPNFVGTIQTFVHHFFVNQALNYYYGTKIEIVDTEVAYGYWKKEFWNLSKQNSLIKHLYSIIKNSNREVASYELEKFQCDVRYLEEITLLKCIHGAYYFNFEGFDKNLIPVELQAVSNDIFYSRMFGVIKRSELDYTNKSVMINNNIIEWNSDIAQEYIKFRETFFKEGILSFEDAFVISFRYMSEVQKNVNILASNRFKYLFIDEVQDLDEKQVKCIEWIFKPSDIIVQKFGDVCQSIFSESFYQFTNNQYSLALSTSNRFGENIAKPLRTVCLKNNHSLNGNPLVFSHKPIMIVYESPLKVLPFFVDLLSEIRIREMDNRTIAEYQCKEKRLGS